MFETRKVIGAVYFYQDGKMVGEIRGTAQRHARAMARAPELLTALKKTLNSLAYILDSPDDVYPHVRRCAEESREEAYTLIKEIK